MDKTKETGNQVYRSYKDRLFRMVFREKKELLGLYNAVNGTSYTDPEAFTVVTLENAIYMNMKNDLAVVMDFYMDLYEHQSTYNPNRIFRFATCIMWQGSCAAGAVVGQFMGDSS